jgi:hypothetical protein
MLDEQGEFAVHIQDAATLDNDDIGDDFGIVADATNLIWRVDNTETTSKVFCVVAFGPKPDGSGGTARTATPTACYIARSARGGQAVLKA